MSDYFDEDSTYQGEIIDKLASIYVLSDSLCFEAEAKGLDMEFRNRLEDLFSGIGELSNVVTEAIREGDKVDE